jgi:hypothetical protein
MPNRFKTIFSILVSNCLFILLCGLVISKSTKPFIIELRERWHNETEDSAMKDINNCCSQIFCFKPESHLCEFDKQFHRDFVDHIRKNECYDLYEPDDIRFFKDDSNPSNTCKTLEHFQTPLTRCLYSNKFLCDSITGYFKRKNEEVFLLALSYVVVSDGNSRISGYLDNIIHSFVSSKFSSKFSSMSDYISNLGDSIYSFGSLSKFSSMSDYISNLGDSIYSFGSLVSNPFSGIPFNADKIFSFVCRLIPIFKG